MTIVNGLKLHPRCSRSPASASENTRKTCKSSLTLTIKIPEKNFKFEQSFSSSPSVFVANFEHVFVSWKVLVYFNYCMLYLKTFVWSKRRISSVNILSIVWRISRRALVWSKRRISLFIFCPLFDTFPGGLPKGMKDWGKEGDIKFVDAVMLVLFGLHCCEAENFACKISCCIWTFSSSFL